MVAMAGDSGTRTALSGIESIGEMNERPLGMPPLSLDGVADRSRTSSFLATGAPKPASTGASGHRPFCGLRTGN